MANFVPRLEWNDLSVVGDITSASAVITGVASTANIYEGMILNNANFAANSYVVSKTVNSITMSNPASMSINDITLNFFERLDFDYPSSKQGEPTYQPNETISESLSGIRQVQVNSIIKKIDIEMRFVTPTLKNKLETRFYLPWAIYGKAFRYYESKDEIAYENYELEVVDFKPIREIPKQGNFLFKIPFKLRRVYV